jgi:transposase
LPLAQGASEAEFTGDSSTRERKVRPGEVVVYVDEVDIHLNPKIGRDWMLRGQQKTMLTPGKNEKRYLAGALEVATGRLIWVEAERKTSDLFIGLLWQLLKEYPWTKCIHVVLDNFKIHHSQRTQMAVASAGSRIRLHFLPPYCPDHNCIERVWKDLHDNVTRNHRCQSREALMTEVYVGPGAESDRQVKFIVGRQSGIDDVDWQGN